MLFLMKSRLLSPWSHSRFRLSKVPASLSRVRGSVLTGSSIKRFLHFAVVPTNASVHLFDKDIRDVFNFFLKPQLAYFSHRFFSYGSVEEHFG